MSSPAKDRWSPSAATSISKTRPLGLVLSQLLRAGLVGSVVLIGLLANDWIASVALIALYTGWKLLNENGPPVIAASFTLQWVQVTAAVVYFALTGRAVYQMRYSDYRPMVLIGLAAIAALFAGVYLGAGLRRKASTTQYIGSLLPFNTRQIAVAYCGALAISGLVQRFAWSAAGWTQGLLVLNRVRFVLLFFLITRLVRPRPRLTAIAALLLLEVALGFTGFFADFREPLLVSGLAIVGAMDRRKFSTWMLIASIVLLAVSSALIWTAIKPTVRKSYVASASTMGRLNSAVNAAASTVSPAGSRVGAEVDTLVSRLWSVYYPALALKRVPSVVPYENGTILMAAVDNVLTPRLFNPDKPAVPSPSDEVRKYAGVWVRGSESNTSIAFGYVGESYVDFGVPWMFAPIFVYGLLIGVAYRLLTTRIKHAELRAGLTIVIFMGVLGSYETSWVMMIGPAITTLAILGGAGIALDRFLCSLKADKMQSFNSPAELRARS
jgi:hypothetical protein